MGGKQKTNTTKIEKEISVQIGRNIIVFLLIASAIIGAIMTVTINNANSTEISLESEVAAWETSDFFRPYIAIGENLAVSPQIQQMLLGNGAGSNISMHPTYASNIQQLRNLVDANADAVATTWVVDLDSKSVIMSNGYTSVGEFDAALYEWYSCVDKQKPVFSEPYQQYSDSQEAVISIASPVFDSNKNVIGITGVDVKLNGSEVTVKGPKGTLTQKVHADIKLEQENGQLVLTRPTDGIEHRSQHGLFRALINNMVVGVSEGYKKELELVGVGYRATSTGQVLELALGYSHAIYLQLPPEVKVEAKTERNKNPLIILESIDKQLLGQVCAKIRTFRKPEPYKGKGIKFVGEVIRRKSGKSASAK